MESRYRVLLFDLLPQVILHHKVDRPVGLQPQHIAQIIMLPVPYQQALPAAFSHQKAFWFWYNGYMP